MAPYIFGERNKIHIINLEKSQPMFGEALNYLGKMVANGGKVLFVGTKRSAREAVKNHAESCGMPYVNNRWLGGMLTNFHTVKQSIKRLKELEEMIEGKGAERLGKREVLQISREVEKLNRSLGGIKNMNILPDVLFIIDVGYEEIAVKEAVKLGIPVVAVVDSNNSLQGVDYVIPGNDDAIRAIELYTSVVANEVMQAKASSQTITGDENEFVEVKDEAAEKKKPKAKAKPKAKPKAAPKKKAAAKADADAAPAEEAKAAESDDKPAESSD
jgi:small subunit ribosomal protein S2